MKKVVFVVAALALLLSLVVGCGGSSTPAASSSSSSNSGSAPSLKEALKDGKWKDNFSAEMVATQGTGAPESAKMMMKGQNVRVEATQEGKKIVIIVNATKKEMYMYSPDEKSGLKMPFTSDADNPLKDLTSLTDEVPTDAKYEGTESLDGKSCYVYTFKDGNDEGKIWVWKDQGFPLKVEAKTKDGTQKVEFKNVEVGKVSDSSFDPPKDITMTDMSK